MQPGQSARAKAFWIGLHLQSRGGELRAREHSAGARAGGGRGERNGRACRAGGIMGWQRTSSEPLALLLSCWLTASSGPGFTQRKDKTPSRWEEFAPPEDPPTPIWKGRHALRAGPCLVRQRTCG